MRILKALKIPFIILACVYFGLHLTVEISQTIFDYIVHSGDYGVMMPLYVKWAYAVIVSEFVHIIPVILSSIIITALIRKEGQRNISLIIYVIVYFTLLFSLLIFSGFDYYIIGPSIGMLFSLGYSLFIVMLFKKPSSQNKIKRNKEL